MNIKLLWKHLKIAWKDYKKEVSFFEEKIPEYTKYIGRDKLKIEYDNLYSILKNYRSVIIYNLYTFEKDVYARAVEAERKLLAHIEVMKKQGRTEFERDTKFDQRWENKKADLIKAGWKI